jgi:membrane protein
MFAIPISWSELAKRTAREFMADNCLGLAAQLAYYCLLALVPAIVFLVALISFFPGQWLEQMTVSVMSVSPPEMANIVATQIRSVAAAGGGGLLTFGFAMALWSSSAAIVSICDALNRAYDIEEGRPWWKVRLTAILLTLGIAALVLVSVTLVIAGPWIAEWLARTTGLGGVFEWSWKILQWPLVFALVSTGLGLLYYFGPDAEQDWVWISPGAVMGTLLWLIASLAFRFYVTQVTDYNATYGALGGIIVLMLWFYISGMAILAGAEMNAEIEHASPYGKAEGEKVPGARKVIGARAARAYANRPAAHPREPISSRQPARPAASREAGWFPGLPVFLVSWWFRRKAKG